MIPSSVKSVLDRALYRAGYVLVRRGKRSRVVDFSEEGASITDVERFRHLYTAYRTDDLYTGRFDEAFRTAIKFDTRSVENPDLAKARARMYFACKFAELTEQVPGDLLFVGVAYGTHPHCVWEYLGERLKAKGKRLILMDPYTAVRHKGATEVRPKFTTDHEAVRASFGDAPVDMVVDYAPDGLSKIKDRQLSYVGYNSGDVPSGLKSMPIICDQLSPGGIMLHASYGHHRKKEAGDYAALLAKLPGTTINLLNGMALFVKH